MPSSTSSRIAGTKRTGHGHQAAQQLATAFAPADTSPASRPPAPQDELPRGFAHSPRVRPTTDSPALPATRVRRGFLQRHLRLSPASSQPKRAVSITPAVVTAQTLTRLPPNTPNFTGDSDCRNATIHPTLPILNSAGKEAPSSTKRRQPVREDGTSRRLTDTWDGVGQPNQGTARRPVIQQLSVARRVTYITRLHDALSAHAMPRLHRSLIHP